MEVTLATANPIYSFTKGGELKARLACQCANRLKEKEVGLEVEYADYILISYRLRGFNNFVGFVFLMEISAW